MSREYTSNDGYIDMGGWSIRITEVVDRGGYSVREPVRNKTVELDRKTGDHTVLKEHPLEQRAREEYYEALEAMAEAREE